MFWMNRMMSSDHFDTWGATIEHELHTHKSKYVLQGILFISAGILAAIFSATTALSIEMMVGAILLLTGIFQLILTLKSKMHGWSFFSSYLSIVIGLLMLLQPLPILLAFVTLMAIFLTFEGLTEIMLSFQFRPAHHWNWMLFSGLTSLFVTMLLWIGFPTLDLMYLGWIIAINLVLYGFSLLMLVWRAETTDSKLLSMS